MIGTGRPEGGTSSVVAVISAGCEGLGRERGWTLVECTTGRCERLTDLKFEGSFPITSNFVEVIATDLTVGDGFIDVTMLVCAAEPGCTSAVQRWEWNADGVQLRST